MAKKKDSKVSISKVDKVLKVSSPVISEIEIGSGEDTFICEVKSFLSFEEFTLMTQAAVLGVFPVDPETGEEVYSPEAEQVAKFDAVLTYVANFKTDMTIDRVFALMYGTNLAEQIRACWNVDQQKAFEDAFAKGVQMHRDLLVAGERAKLRTMEAQLDKAIGTFETFMQSFDGVTSDAIQNALTAMANLTEDKLVDEVLKYRDESFVEQRARELGVVE